MPWPPIEQPLANNVVLANYLVQGQHISGIKIAKFHVVVHKFLDSSVI